MSGGVDSSVSAYLLQKEGYDITGVTMSFNLLANSEDAKQCFSPEAVVDAEKVCKQLNIPHYAIERTKELKEFVVDNFIEEYKKGRTPNPCVRCNQRLKFGSLIDKCKELNLDAIATGHYAKISEDGDGFHLEMADDRHKDQTYFLWGIKKEDLGSIIFPVSGMKKPELRKIARDAGLAVAEKKESQDICFVPDGNYRELLADYGVESKPGNMINRNGDILGEHTGIEAYTIGQRKGLGIAVGRPQYVIDIDIVKNVVIVGDREELDAKGLFVSEFNYLEPFPSNKISAKIRSTMAPVGCSVEKDGELLKILFDTPQFAVSAGQSVVLYSDTRVIGGGIIDSRIDL